MSQNNGVFNKYHNLGCPCRECEADEKNLREEIEVTDLSHLVRLMTQSNERKSYMSVLGDYTGILSGLGLLGLAIFQVSNGDLAHAGTSFLGALAAFHFHAKTS